MSHSVFWLLKAEASFQFLYRGLLLWDNWVFLEAHLWERHKTNYEIRYILKQIVVLHYKLKAAILLSC